jgi:hypothetical protein
MDSYIIELPFLRYDKQELVSFMKKSSPTQWASEGYANKYYRPKDGYHLFEDIYNQIPEFEIDNGKIFYAELNPSDFLKPHTDLYRKASINIPLVGDFTKTPVTFHSEESIKKEHILYKHFYNDVATIINTEVYHSVFNTTNDTRYMLSFSVYKTWDEIKVICDKYNNAVT